MITIKIDGNTRNIDDVEMSWINEQINNRRSTGQSVCARVEIHEPPAINVMLTSSGCPGGAGGRAPNEKERRILDLWNKLGLQNPEFTGGNLIAFLNQVNRYI